MKKKSFYTRREFIKTSAKGLAAGSVVPFFNRASLVSLSDTNRKIIYRTLGRTGLKLSAVSFGIMRSDTPALISKAIHMGINHFDTAYSYQGGNNEKMLGEVLKKEKARDRVVIATKVKLPRDKKTGQYTAEATKSNFIKMFEDSLKRLQTDYVDILYSQNIISAHMVFHEPVLEALTQLKKEGKVRFAGISTHAQEEEVIRETVTRDFYDVLLTAYNFKKHNREAIKAAIAAAFQKGLGIVAMKTQVRGYDASSLGISPYQACLKWVLNNSHITCAIPGMTTFNHLDENHAVMGNTDLSPREARNLGYYSKLLDGHFCHGCRECIGTCLHHLDIPEYQRAYMYYRGYNDRDRALDLVQEVAGYSCADACDSCTVCTAQCSHGIDIAGRIAELRLLEANA